MTVPLEDQVWDAKLCGAYLLETPAYFLRLTRHGAGFPAALPAFAGGRPRWSAAAVIKWALGR